ncbi:hypothetical protein GCM10028808_20880 [Spirosoma migulaei]
MGHIKEPKGVDFIIASDPLTDQARQEISEFIRNYKNNTTNKKAKSATIIKQPRTARA